MPSPHELIKKVQEKILHFEASQLSLSETETRRALIDPIFAAIGWDTGNPLAVRMEWRKDPSDRPVDYAFMINGVPKLLVEAERLREDITDKKWRDQLLLYSTQAGVRWCALTNGNVIRIYNSLAEEAAADKLLFEIEVRTIDTLAGIPVGAFANRLSLLSEESLRERKIDEVWDNIYTKRKVFDYLENRKENLIDDIVKNAKLAKKSVGEVLGQIIELRESFLEKEEDVPPDESKPWLTNGEEWHLVDRLKSKSMEQLSDAAKRLLRLNGIIGSALPNLTGPYWSQKYYISFKMENVNWLYVGTLPKTLDVNVKCDASQFSLEDLSERLAVKIFDPKAEFSEKFNLPSSVRKGRNETTINLKIKPDFDLGNEEFRRFLEEAYNSFAGRG